MVKRLDARSKKSWSVSGLAPPLGAVVKTTDDTNLLFDNMERLEEVVAELYPVPTATASTVTARVVPVGNS